MLNAWSARATAANREANAIPEWHTQKNFQLFRRPCLQEEILQNWPKLRKVFKIRKVARAKGIVVQA
jgi:hypothetical protein